jgi:hypothetical protein
MATDTEPTTPTPQPSRPTLPRTSRPVSEALLNDKVGLPRLEQRAHTAKHRDAVSLLNILPLLRSSMLTSLLVGPLPFLPPDSVRPGIRLRCHIFRSIVQASRMAGVAWAWVWGRKGG